MDRSTRHDRTSESTKTRAEYLTARLSYNSARHKVDCAENPAAGIIYELLSIEDLVKAKKTQRDKDWPMIRRLVEAHHRQFSHESTSAMVSFWLREATSPDLLQIVAMENNDLLPLVQSFRPWLLSIDLNDTKAIERELEADKEKERLDVLRTGNREHVVQVWVGNEANEAD